MCELFALSSRVPTTVSFSLQRFAQRGGLQGKTLDGWGLAYYDGRDLRLYREPEPARDSVWLPFIGSRQAPSTNGTYIARSAAKRMGQVVEG